MPRSIPNSDHVVRYLSKNKWCPDDGSGLQDNAFGDVSNSQSGVSVNWLEYFNRDNLGNSLEEINRTCGLCTKESGRFLRLNVGRIKKAVGEISPPVCVIHDGEDDPENKSHAEIRPYVEEVFTALFLCADQHGKYLEVPEVA